MNKNVFCFLLIVTFLTLAGCDMATVLHGEKPPDTSVALSGINLTPEEADILVNGTVTLNVNFTPAEATNKNVTWDSDLKNIATVTNGIVRGVSAGIAVITVTSKDGGHKDMCTVTVTAGEIKVTGVSLNKSNTTLSVGETETLTPIFTPAEPTNKKVSWDSDDKSIATVSNGIVRGMATGTAFITVTTEDGNKQATCAVTVIPAAISVTFNGVTANGSATQTTTALTLDFSAPIPNFSAADITLSGVNGVSKGTLTGNNNSYTLTISGFTSGGNLTVAVYKSGFAIGGSPKTVLIYYNVSVTGVSLNKTTLPLNVGGSETLTATLTPSNASNKNVNWSSSAPNIATVSSNGLVTAVLPGNATITVTTEDGNRTADCVVSVSLSISGLASYLATLPINDASSPHNITLRVTSANEFYTIKSALQGATNKFIELDLSGSTVNSIVLEAFWECSSLVSITIPNSITSIAEKAFYSCTSLKSITIPNGVTSIEDWTFANCSNLVSVTLGNNVSSIGKNAFSACSNLTSITLPDRIGSIGYAAFYECTSLTDISIPSNIYNIDDFAFSFCSSITSITLGNGIGKIGAYAFQSCLSLTSVTFLRTMPSDDFASTAFSRSGNLRDAFYATNSGWGTPGTYTRESEGLIWTRQ
jgi:uncharacterized protein YjdB